MKYFIYCRKSQEAEDRQVMSLEGQIKEIEKAYANHNDIEVVGFFEESKSAKYPGRPQFTQMIERISQGEAQGIISWHPDRLARNSVDGGQIIFMLDQGQLLDLKFCTSSFENSPQGKFMLGIMFSNSKYYSDGLSVNVKRGMKLKLQKGWKPGRAPLGYKNCRETSTIIPDTEHFKVVRNMFDLILCGHHTPSSIHRIMCDEWNYRTPIRKSYGGKALTLSAVYKLLSNPFYAGDIRWKGQLYPGNHKPVVSKDEFLRVQKLLGADQFTSPRKLVFKYSRLFTCGNCGLSVTAEKKNKPSGRTYIYYHCTRRHSTPRCTEPSIEEKSLETQVAEFISRVTIQKPFYDWLIKQLHTSQTDKHHIQQKRITEQTQDVTKYEKQLETLIDLRQQNLITDTQFLERRENTQIEYQAAQERLEKAKEEQVTFEPVKILMLFLFQAKNCFLHASHEDKRKLLQILCSNPSLKAKKAILEAKKPFEEIVDLDKFVRMCAHGQKITTATACQNSNVSCRISQLLEVCNQPEALALALKIKHYLRNHTRSDLLDLQVLDFPE